MVTNFFRVTEIHRALQFHQKPYLKMFIDTFVSKCSKSKSKVQKEMYKLILNLAFEKMCESVQNRSRCDVVTCPKECARIFADPNFTTFTTIDPNVVLLYRKKRNVLLNKDIGGGGGVQYLKFPRHSCCPSFTMCVRYNGQGRGRFRFTMGTQILYC
jgi:hypothetical protein